MRALISALLRFSFFLAARVFIRRALLVGRARARVYMYISIRAISSRFSRATRREKAREGKKTTCTRDDDPGRTREEEERKIESFFRSGRLSESERRREKEREEEKTFLFFSNALVKVRFARSSFSLSLSLSLSFVRVCDSSSSAYTFLRNTQTRTKTKAKCVLLFLPRRRRSHREEEEEEEEEERPPEGRGRCDQWWYFVSRLGSGYFSRSRLSPLFSGRALAAEAFPPSKLMTLLSRFLLRRRTVTHRWHRRTAILVIALQSCR